MKVYLDTVGCRLNQSEIESYARQFRDGGQLLVADPKNADLAVINTCTVTAAAAADSRKKIRGLHRAGVSQILVTGCWSTLEPEAAARLPGVTEVIPNAEKESLVKSFLGIQINRHNPEHSGRVAIPGERKRTRAFIKVQDGCDNRCTYCVTTLARGSSRSRALKDILGDIQYAIQGGTKEIVLTGVHIGSWGKDLEKPSNLQNLLQTILHHTDTPRLRVSSIEPWDIQGDFFHSWQNPRLLNHLHLPLQSGSADTLRRMARKITPKSYAKLVNSAREIIPDVAISTDIIVGFPGETEVEFRESLEFIQEMGFARGHVFTFSEREGTVAAHLKESVPYDIRKQRNLKVRNILSNAEEAFQKKHVGDCRSALWEQAKNIGPSEWIHAGYTDNYLRVTASSSNSHWNQIMEVNLTGLNGCGLFGEIIG